MRSAAFRTWLAARGCMVRQHEWGHGCGHALVAVAREGHSAQLALVGSHEALDESVVHAVCERLGLDWNDLPGPGGRA